ncbi:MAG TPA: hypothetical protein VIS72_00425 [Anaerolineales bacterium]
MNINRLENLAPLSGIVMVGVLVTGHVLTGGFGGYQATAEKAIESVNQDPTRVYVGTLLAGFYSVILLIWFAGSVFSALREREGGAGRLSTIAFGGGVVSAIALALGYGVVRQAVARAGIPGGLGFEAATVMHALYSVFLAGVLSVGLAAFIGATGIVSLRTQLFPTWLGWTSVAMAIGLMTPLHFIFEGLAIIWITIVSILLYQRGKIVSTS